MTLPDEQVKDALKILEQVASTPIDVPAVVVVPSEGEGSITGNRYGLIRLAVSALRASAGENQRFEDSSLAVQDEYGTTFHGVALDDYAHYDLPKESTRWERIKSATILLAFVAVIAVIFVAGIQTTSHWLWNRITHGHPLQIHF